MAKKASQRRKSQKSNKSFPIVGIGASAGGIEAVTELLRNLSPATGMAYVYVQHLDPTHDSKLASVLSRATQMPVEEAKSGMRVSPNNVYVLPPNKSMQIEGDVLRLNPRAASPTQNLPINDFFTSLAERQKEGAIGVLLSGNANDGSLGLKAIKIAGGLTLVQDDSARFQSMATSAVAEGVVDLVLSPKEIAEELERLSTQTSILQIAMNPEAEAIEAETHPEDFNSIIALLRKTTGVDFAHYKKSTIKRRIIRRMLLHKLPNLKEYSAFVRQHTGEVNVLYQDLLINVTCFFRDSEAIEFLRKNVIPKILKSKSGNEPVRVWVPACSSGEEAYSLAILLLESLGDKVSSRPIHIFATDLSESAIAKARAGVYTKSDLADMSPRRIQRFFSKIDGSYRIIKTIRHLCVFAPHNIFKDPPFSHLDIISCCNLLIYLDSILQKKIFATFHYALNPAGYLVLGKSETIGTSANLFSSLDKKVRIYQRKKDVNAKAIFEMNYRILEPEKIRPLKTPKEAQRETGQMIDIERTVDNLLLSKYVPPSVVVNEDLDIIQFRGSTGMFLEPAPGKASLNLLKMARAGLGFELRNIVHKVNKSNEPFKKTGLEIKHKNNNYIISIEVVPIKGDSEDKYFLILFEEQSVASSVSSMTLSRDKRIKQLENELLNAREDMRSMIEEQEAVNEELQSANEEIVSSNEELQSINEELETSKEEVESANEELMTINSEMQVRNDQLSESYEYAEAVISTIREAALVLDSDLCVKTANKSFYRIFNLTEGEVEGRLVYDLADRQWNIPKLRELLEETIPANMQFNGLEITANFAGIGEKIMLVNARRIVQKTHRRQLILLALEDITEHATARRLIGEREAWFRNMANNAPVMIWTVDSQKSWNFFNKTWLEYTGRTTADLGEWIELVHEDDRGGLLKLITNAFDKRKDFNAEYRLRRANGEYRWVLSSAKLAPAGDFNGFVGITVDIHDQKMFVDKLETSVRERTMALRQTNNDLHQLNEELRQFAYVASHDLQEPLRKIITFSNMIKRLYHDNKKDEVGHYIEKISESSNRMSTLIEDLLNFSRSTKPDFKFVPIDLNEVISTVLKDFDEVIKESKVTIKKDKLPSIMGISVQITQLFHNLISNAIKFSISSQKPLIHIKLTKLKKADVPDHLPSNKKYIKISIKDNGIGFEQQYAEQIFVIFQRLHDRKTFPGTGIGLALCKKIVGNHNGYIYAESKPGKGATFNVVLPVES